MTPQDVVSKYKFDERMVTGEFFPDDPLRVEKDDHVGVVLMNMGGPDTLEAIKPFLYNLFMDPAIIDLNIPLINVPLPGYLRHLLCSAISYFRADAKKEEYEAIGGGSPINELTREQAERLESALNEYSGGKGLRFSTYVAMRYWKPFSEEAARSMMEDNVDKVVLLPLYPQYSKTTTGSSFLYWKMLEEEGEIPPWPTTFVQEYAANPNYLQAVGDRIDEGLERFDETVRDDVHLLFSAHGTPVYEMTDRGDPYCCLIHSSVDKLMKMREHDRPFHVAFQSKVGPAKWFSPSTPDKLEELADEGIRHVLVIPIAFVTDHVETSFELDIEIREEAEEAGIEQYEVTDGINDHPSFIRALSENVFSQLELPEEVQDTIQARGELQIDTPVSDLPRYDEDERDLRCKFCEHVTEARCWTDDAPETVDA